MPLQSGGMMNLQNRHQAHAGERIVNWIVAYYLSAEILGLFFKSLIGQAFTGRDVFRLILTALICIFLHLGYNWARWTLVFIACMAVFTGVYGLYLMVTLHSPFWLLLFAVFLFAGNVASGYYLVTSEDVNEFIRSKGS
jgi:hypothetical protein